jgi:hypothetical protein
MPHFRHGEVSPAFPELGWYFSAGYAAENHDRALPDQILPDLNTCTR